MESSLRLRASNPGVGLYWKKNLDSNIDTQRSVLLSRKPPGPAPPFCSLTVESRSDAAPPSHYTFTVGSSCSDAAPPSHYTSSVGSSSLLLSHWNLTQRHITVLNVFACVTAICATWLFCSAIPALLAFKRAAESLEKLMDTTREELPDTMAAIRLSGMEISDLTTELSDLGQEVTQGVRSSTRAVRIAEQRLRRFTNIAPSSGTDQPES